MAQILHWGTKDPEAILNYSLDWQRWLKGDEIATHTVVVTNVDLDQSVHTVNTVVAILSGGVRGATATINIRINTAGGLRDERTVTLDIDDK